MAHIAKMAFYTASRTGGFDNTVISQYFDKYAWPRRATNICFKNK